MRDPPIGVPFGRGICMRVVVHKEHSVLVLRRGSAGTERLSGQVAVSRLRSASSHAASATGGSSSFQPIGLHLIGLPVAAQRDRRPGECGHLQGSLDAAPHLAQVRRVLPRGGVWVVEQYQTGGPP